MGFLGYIPFSQTGIRLIHTVAACRSDFLSAKFKRIFSWRNGKTFSCLTSGVSYWNLST